MHPQSYALLIKLGQGLAESLLPHVQVRKYRGIMRVLLSHNGTQA
jgi:hypothetical protein